MLNVFSERWSQRADKRLHVSLCYFRVVARSLTSLTNCLLALYVAGSLLGKTEKSHRKGSRNKLVETSATLLGTGALLVVTRFATRNKCLTTFCFSFLRLNEPSWNRTPAPFEVRTHRCLRQALRRQLLFLL